MNLFEKLVKNYGYGTPFYLEEVSFNDYSLSWIKKELKVLVNDKKIIRYERGLYYIPEKTIFGLSSLNPQKIIMKKYLSNYSGYFSGLYFANKIGLSSQMPNIMEIYTNNEKSRVRKISINNQTIILRKARVNITKDNFNALSFLELMNSFPLDYFNYERKVKIKAFIKDNGIKKSQITTYAKYFPDLVMRNLIESEIIYDIA